MWSSEREKVFYAKKKKKPLILKGLMLNKMLSAINTCNVQV